MATNTVTTEQVREAIEQFAAMVTAASISPQTLASILEMLRNLNDQEREKVVEVADAKIADIQELGVEADKVTLGSGATVEDEIPSLIAEVFPVTVRVVSSNAGIREVGSSIVPSIVLEITRRGNDVAESSVVSFSPDDGSLSQDHKTYTGAQIASGGKTYQITVIQDGQTVNVDDQVFAFSNYRYKGSLNSKPNTANIVAAIRALPKELSTITTLGQTTLEANKYYLFAVKGNVNLIVKNAKSGGTIDIPDTDKGTCTVPQENGQGSNTYSWVIVPASSSSWYFQIVNS